MPSTYTPDDENNPASITLPSDGDDNDAEAFNSPYRDLADKIAYTQATTPLLAALNTFTRGQKINPPSDVDALISSNRYPADANRWARILEVQLEINRRLRMFQGGFSGAGRFAITVNAEWNIETQQWSRDDNTGESSALIMATDYISFHAQVPGSDPWSTWPTSTGSVGNVRCSGEFVYTQSKTRVRTIPVSSASGGALFFSGADGSVQPNVVGDHSFIRWPIRLAFGAVLQKVYVIHNCSVSAAETFRVTRRRTTWDPFDVELPTEDELVEAVSGTGVGAHMTTLNVAGTTVDRYDEICLLWEPSALLNNTVNAITVEFQDNGPSPIG